MQNSAPQLKPGCFLNVLYGLLYHKVILKFQLILWETLLYEILV